MCRNNIGTKYPPNIVIRLCVLQDSNNNSNNNINLHIITRNNRRYRSYLNLITTPDDESIIISIHQILIRHQDMVSCTRKVCYGVKRCMAIMMLP